MVEGVEAVIAADGHLSGAQEIMGCKRLAELNPVLGRCGKKPLQTLSITCSSNL
jgi:hypothetical protein